MNHFTLLSTYPALYEDIIEAEPADFSAYSSGLSLKSSTIPLIMYFQMIILQ